MTRRASAGSFPAPRRWVGPVSGSVLAVIAWDAVAHNSGSGWVQALGALLVGFLGVGLVGPMFAVRRIRCDVVASPADAVTGRPSHFVVAVSTPSALRCLLPQGPEVVTGRRSPVQLPFTPSSRGIVRTATIQVASAAPFGLLWWTKRVTVELPRLLHVAPAPSGDEHVFALDVPELGDDGARVDRRVGDSRGVRPYHPGDLRHWIHWPSTAHTGELMVREMEGPAAHPVTVRALLPVDLDAADEAAARALAAVTGLLRSGRSVVLVTAEAGGTVSAPVYDALDAGRRLARAVPERPPPARPRAPRARGPALQAAEPADDTPTPVGGWAR